VTHWKKRFNPNPAEPNYVVALNLLPRTPAWLQALHANPMYLGLDLRGGVHFLLQVDMAGCTDQEGRSAVRQRPAHGPA
jgi:preprotein translocase subunit SecD